MIVFVAKWRVAESLGCLLLSCFLAFLLSCFLAYNAYLLVAPFGGVVNPFSALKVYLFLTKVYLILIEVYLFLTKVYLILIKVYLFLTKVYLILLRYTFSVF